MQDIQRLTLADALKYHSVYYSPQNAIGSRSATSTRTKCSSRSAESFGPIKNGPKPPPVLEVEPPQQGERKIVLRHAANLPAFTEAYHVPNYRVGGADAFALEIASEILADGKSSRLYRTMVLDKRMVVEVSASYDMTSFDPGLFELSAQMRPGVKTDDAIAEADKAIEQLKAQAGRRRGIAEGQESRTVLIRVRARLDLRGGDATRSVGDAGRLPPDGQLSERDRQGYRGRCAAGCEKVPGRG